MTTDSPSRRLPLMRRLLECCSLGRCVARLCFRGQGMQRPGQSCASRTPGASRRLLPLSSSRPSSAKAPMTTSPIPSASSGTSGLRRWLEWGERGDEVATAGRRPSRSCGSLTHPIDKRMGTQEWTDSFVPILLSKRVPIGWGSTKQDDVKKTTPSAPAAHGSSDTPAVCLRP